MARPNKSADKITDALIALITERGYGDLSIQSIAERAGVSRICFYRNFQSKEQVLERFIDRVVAEIEAEVRKGHGTGSLREYYELLFGTVGRYGAVVREIEKANLGTLMTSRFNEKLFHTPLSTRGVCFKPYERRFYAGAFSNVLVEWAVNGTRESAAEMAEMCSRLTNGGTQL